MFPPNEEDIASASTRILHEIVIHFETLVTHIENAIETFVTDERGTVELEALHRAKDAVERGAHIACNAASELRTAFESVAVPIARPEASLAASKRAQTARSRFNDIGNCIKTSSAAIDQSRSLLSETLKLLAEGPAKRS